MDSRTTYLTVFDASGANIKSLAKDIDRCVNLCQDDGESWVETVRFAVEPETEEVRGQLYALILCRSPREES